jgi:lambda repressor-like predicted transcriptional regulator
MNCWSPPLPPFGLPAAGISLRSVRRYVDGARRSTLWNTVDREFIRGRRRIAVYILHMPETASPYQALATALRERLAAISDRELYKSDPALHLEKLKAASERVTALQSQLPPPIDPQLAHYLQRCSYDKALAFLEEM